jgi:hypothetical protein
MGEGAGIVVLEVFFALAIVIGLRNWNMHWQEKHQSMQK